MRLPRPEDLFLHDVEIFMQENKIKSRSKSGRPGNILGTPMKSHSPDKNYVTNSEHHIS